MVAVVCLTVVYFLKCPLALGPEKKGPRADIVESLTDCRPTPTILCAFKPKIEEKLSHTRMMVFYLTIRPGAPVFHERIVTIGTVELTIRS